MFLVWVSTFMLLLLLLLLLLVNKKKQYKEVQMVYFPLNVNVVSMMHFVAYLIHTTMCVRKEKGAPTTLFSGFYTYEQSMNGTKDGVKLSGN